MEKSKIISLLKELRRISGNIYLFSNRRSENLTLNRLLHHYNNLCRIAKDQRFLDTDHFDLKDENNPDSVSTAVYLLINYLDDTE